MKGWAFRSCQTGGGQLRVVRHEDQVPEEQLRDAALCPVEHPVADTGAVGSGERWAACLGQSRNQKLSAAQTDRLRCAVRGSPTCALNPRGWGGMKCGETDDVRLTHQVWIPSSYTQAYPVPTAC